ncbi:osteocalcin [Pogona vitticeps]|uniref:Osteocalcin n=1 Tax=Pogona vitticeps TaxID=103695 RepID=A0A6J0VJK3_9SAUR
MKTLMLVSFLAVATLLCLGGADDSAHSDDARSSEAFLSRRESAALVKRDKKDYGRLYNIVAAPVATPDPLEPYREICELSPGCDELADQIGFKEAYRRYYGPI